MKRQEFDVGDIVQVKLPYNSGDADHYGTIIQRKLINKNTEDALATKKWHLDEYHCRVKWPNGASNWVRAKYLKMVSKAKFKI